MKIVKSLVQALFWAVIGAGWTAAPVDAAGTQILTADRIERGAVQYLLNQLVWEDRAMDIDVHYHDGNLVLPRGRLVLDYRMPGRPTRAGRIPLTLDVRVDGLHQRRIRLNTMVTVAMDVVKTVRPVRRGDILTPNDVTLSTVKTRRLNKRVATRLKDVVGYEARRALRRGKMVTMDTLRKPILVNRGDRVTIRLRKGGMRITAVGIAKDRGTKDSLVEVMNLKSRKTFFARVVDQNTVQVDF
ncbi:MAG: flagellar basal body P-ring formation protein FlgA [Nitrospinaceae bacterium]|nr:flagellar basal body P-ring formation protein FlgA [Nitrospinaceae bacterium]